MRVGVDVGVGVRVRFRGRVGVADAVRFRVFLVDSFPELLLSVVMVREMRHYSGVSLFKASVMCQVFSRLRDNQLLS